MRRLLCLLLVASVMLLSTGSVAGSWCGHLLFNGKDVEVVLILKTVGSSLTGTLVGKNETTSLLDGKVSVGGYRSTFSPRHQMFRKSHLSGIWKVSS
jgi:hypothetical protein